MSSWLMQKCGRASALLGLLIIPAAVLAAPSNDDCGGAEMVTLGTTYNTDNRTAAKDFIDPGVGHSASLTAVTGMTAGVWYRYDSTIAGVISAVETSAQNIASGVWEMDTATASCPTIGPATWSTPNESFKFTASPGKTYYILVFADTTSAPTVPLSITFSQLASPPANDACSGAISVALEQVYTCDNSQAADDPVNLTCATTRGVAPGGVWYRYDATQTGQYTFVESFGNFDLSQSQNVATAIWEMSTASAACPSYSTIPTICQGAERFSLTLTSGNTYYFLIMNDAATGTGSQTIRFQLSKVADAPPSNDTCENALVLSSFPAQMLIDNRTATTDPIDGGGCDAGTTCPYGVWFRYDAPPSSSGVMMIEELDPVSDVAMAVWQSDDCPVLGQSPTVCGVLPFSPNSIQRYGFKVTPNNTYYINLHINSTSIAPFLPMNVKFSLLPSPGDDCSTALPIVGTGGFTFTNVGTSTASAPFATVPFSSETANAAMNYDGWYKWVAPASGQASIINRSIPTMMLSRLAVYEEAAPGECPTSMDSLIRAVNMAGLGINSSVPDGNTETTPHGIDTWNVLAGKTYYFQFGTQLQAPAPPYEFGFAEMELLLEPTPATTGKCAIGSACLLTSAQDCASRGGTYGGNGSVCVSYCGTTTSYPGGSLYMPNADITQSSSITVADNFTVEDVEVEVDLNSQYNSVMYMALIKDGLIVPLSNQARRGYLPRGSQVRPLMGVYTFNDSAASSIFEASLDTTMGTTPLPSGVYRPAGAANVNNGLRTQFHGTPAAGTWTLWVANQGSWYSTLNSWTLRLKRGSGCAPVCVADFNGVNGVTVQDIFDFLTAWLSGNPSADFNGINGVTVQDIFDFLTAWLAGC